MALNTIVQAGDLRKTILPQLADANRNVRITPSLASEVASLCRCLGLNGSSNLRSLEHVVSDFVQGWKITVPRKTSQEWAECAYTFAHQLRGTDTSPSSRRGLELQMAFLVGVRAASETRSNHI